MKINRHLVFWGQILALGLLVFGIYLFTTERDFTIAKDDTKLEQAAFIEEAEPTEESSASEEETESATEFPAVSLADWELLLVNRDNRVEELNPDLGQVETILVDSRIVEATTAFLAAARAIDPAMHLISGYRSVADQEGIYNGYLAQEMAEKGLTEEEATAVVQTYSQPAGASEHHTGLAIDMSTVDQLNQADPTVVAQVREIAADYGFVLRFPENKEAVTGIGYEDWHYRYVGEDSARYMADNQLTLEEYIEEVRNRTS